MRATSDTFLRRCDYVTDHVTLMQRDARTKWPLLPSCARLLILSLQIAAKIAKTNSMYPDIKPKNSASHMGFIYLTRC